VGNGDTDGSTFEELAAAVRVVRDWQATARDENADLRERYEAQLKAAAATEMIGRFRAALDRR
jgi:hypothetical protein